MELPDDELFKELMEHIDDFLDPRLEGDEGGVWNDQPLSDDFKSAITYTILKIFYNFFAFYPLRCFATIYFTVSILLSFKKVVLNLNRNDKGMLIIII